MFFSPFSLSLSVVRKMVGPCRRYPISLFLLLTVAALTLATSCSRKKEGSSSDLTQNTEILPLDPPRRSYWPTNDWRSTTPKQVGMSKEGISSLDQYLFQTTGTEEERKGIRTDGVVVIKNGYIVYERYSRDFTKDSLHNTWSVSKSVCSTLVGIAEKEGLLNIDDKAYRYFPSLNAPEKKAMKIRHILNMSSGIVWGESYETSPLKSDVIAMLYTRGRKDMAMFTAKSKMRALPGTYVYYSSGDTNLLSAILRSAVEKNAKENEKEPSTEWENYPWNKLFDIIGIKNATWERDSSGNFVASSYLYLTPRDLAKLGFLYLNNGQWKGKEILTPDWIQFTRTPAPAYQRTPHYKGIEEDNMTAHWYVNTGVPSADIPPTWKNASSDVFAALGHWGQSMFVIPSLDMIVVRFADDRDGSFSRDRFLELLQKAIEEN